MKFKLIVLFLSSFYVTIVAQSNEDYLQKIYKESLIKGNLTIGMIICLTK